MKRADTDEKIVMSDGKTPITHNFDRIVRENTIITSSAKASADDHYNFQIELSSVIRDIVAIRFIRLSYDYTVPGSNVPRIGYVVFDNLKGEQSHTTWSGDEYHVSFDVEQGSTSANIKGSYTCPTEYIVNFKNTTSKTKKLHVRIYQEDANGYFTDFSTLSYFNMEMEIRRIDHSMNKYKA